MRKDSYFSAILLIFICLWINYHYYSQVEATISGTNTPSSNEETEAANGEDTLETNSVPLQGYDEDSFQQVSWKKDEWPKPLVLVVDQAAPKEETPETVPSEIVAENTNQPEPEAFQNVSMTSDVQNLPKENQAEEKGSKEESKDDTPCADDKDSREKASENQVQMAAFVEKNSDNVSEIDEAFSFQVHSSYKAAEFPDGKSPLNSESPSYEIK